MAAAPLPPPQASAPPQGAPPVPASGNAPTGGPAVLQLVALISKAADQLAQVFPAASPMTEEIKNQLTLAQQKMSETMSAQMPAAPPL